MNILVCFLKVSSLSSDDVDKIVQYPNANNRVTPILGILTRSRSFYYVSENINDLTLWYIINL
jgi:hypothetical protein